MTVHRWFAHKTCPGDYLYNKHYEIAEKVNMAVQAAYAQKVADGSGVASAALTGTEVATQYNTDNGSGLASASTNTLTIKASSAEGAQTYTVTLTEAGKSFQAVTKANVQ